MGRVGSKRSERRRRGKAAAVQTAAATPLSEAEVFAGTLANNPYAGRKEPWRGWCVQSSTASDSLLEDETSAIAATNQKRARAGLPPVDESGCWGNPLRRSPDDPMYPLPKHFGT